MRTYPPLKPMFKYPGSKFKLGPKYPKPRFRTIVEPFAGSACYSLRYHQHKVKLYDKDWEIVSIWDYLINAKESEILSLPDIRAGQHVEELGVCSAAESLIAYCLRAGGRSNKPSKFALGLCGFKPLDYWGPAKRARIASQLPGIRHWEVSYRDYRDIEDNPYATWFIDPPYQVKGKGLYTHGSGGIDFNHLGKWCKERNGQPIVCENEGAEWLPFRFFSRDASGMNRAANKGERLNEVIWTR